MPSESQQTIDLSFAEFQFLLQEHELAIAKDSPLAPLLTVKSKGDPVHLTNESLLKKEGEWHDALIAICNPDFITSSILAFTGVAASASYFTNRKNSKLIVGCWPTDNKKLRISFPWEPMNIIANSLTALVVDDDTSASVIKKMHFSPDGFTAFTAAIDTVRTVLLASTLQRQQIDSFLLPRNQLDKILELSINDKSVDARWLLTLFHTLMPNAMSVSKRKITDKGLKELVDNKLIIIEDDLIWSPTSKLKEIASNWLIPLPAAYHGSVTINLDGSQDIISNISLRGSGPLCLVEFTKSSNSEQTVSLKSMKKDDFWLQLMGQMTPPKVEERPESKLEAEKPKVEKEVNISEESSSELVYKCLSCGALVHKNQKFCTECGHELPDNLEPVQEEPKIKTCSGCGAELTPDAKFCTQCGAKVEEAISCEGIE